MAIRVEPFARQHLTSFEPAPGQRVDLLTRGRLTTIEQSWSFTAFDEDDTPLLCAGALPDPDGIWHGWSLFSVHAAGRMVALTRAVLFLLRHTPSDRIRIAIEPSSASRRRWATMMGFDPLSRTQTIAGRRLELYERSARCGA